MKRLGSAAVLPCFLIALAFIQPSAPQSLVTTVRLPEGGIQPQAVVDRVGTIHVLYFKGEAAHGDLFYARLALDGTFSAPLRVNSQPGSAIATGTMRGGHIAIGRNGRVHVAWHGSDRARPRATKNATPVLYSQLTAGAAAFEPQRNLVQTEVDGLDAGTVAADTAGNVYVAWHAFPPGTRGEADRRVWVTRSTDDGATFSPEVAASRPETGTCGCCGVGAFADRRGTLFLLYRSATDTVHRDTYLLTSRDAVRTFSSTKLQDWNIGACPMSTFSFGESSRDVLAAWETDGQVQWLRIDSRSGARSAIVIPPGSTRNRKHPVIATNPRGETLLAWTEGTAWNKGGELIWQVFDGENRPASTGRVQGVPTWSLGAVAIRPDGGFVVVY